MQRLSHAALAILLVALLSLAYGCKKEHQAEEPTTDPAPGDESGDDPTPGEGTPAETDDTASAEPAPDDASTEPITLPAQEFEPGSEQQQQLMEGAMDLIQQDNLDMAVVYLISLIEDTPEMSLEKLIGYIVLAEVYRNEAQFDKALTRLQEAEKSFPPSYEIYVSMAEIHLTSNQIPEAIEAYKKALEVDPLQLSTHAELVYLAAAAGDTTTFEAAIATYESALEQITVVLNNKRTPTETLVYVLQALTGLRDERLTDPLLGLLGHEDLMVVGTTLEILINAGYKNALPQLNDIASGQTDPTLQQAYAQAIEVLETLDEAYIASIPVMPPP